MQDNNESNNNEYNYYMNSENTLKEIETSNLEKDIGVYISNDLKWAKQVNYAAGNANSMLSQLNNTFRYKDKDLMKTLYSVYVRPHLEFAIQAWNPYYKKDINQLEYKSPKSSHKNDTRIKAPRLRRNNENFTFNNAGSQKRER
jgi:hypothetical protein